MDTDRPLWQCPSCGRSLSPRNVLHAFQLTTPEEVDEQFRGWLAEAYDVGCQRHRG